MSTEMLVRAIVALLMIAPLLAAADQPPAAAPDLPPGEAVPIAPELTATRITDRAILITHSWGWNGNSLLVEMPDNTLILCDTPYWPEATKTLLDWIRTRYGDRKLIAINSHFHYDAAGGNAALLAAGVPVYGSDATVTAMKGQAERLRRNTLDMLKGDEKHAAIFRTLELVPPDHTFDGDKGLTLTLGGEDVRLFDPGDAHAPGNIVVWFPAQKLLFAGCIAITGNRFGYMGDMNIAAYPPALKQMMALHAEVVVPGHGTRTDPGVLENTKRIASMWRE